MPVAVSTAFLSVSPLRISWTMVRSPLVPFVCWM